MIRSIVKYIFITLITLILIIWVWVILPFWGTYPLNFPRHSPSQRPKVPAWVLKCWVWEDDVNTAEATLELVNGHLERDFPIGVVLIDSPWSLRYNDFVVDESRFPEPEKFFRYFEDKGIRVVLWMTPMVNSKNDDTAIQDSGEFYQEAKTNGYLVGKGVQVKWWKGTGGFIDYTNPTAINWWQGLQNQVLRYGIDGWKLDDSATLLRGKIGPIPIFYLRSYSGILTPRKYMDLYYIRELEYGRIYNPEFATLSRSIDVPTSWAHPEGFAPLKASTVNWVGDTKHEWEYEKRGLEKAIHCILWSANLGYCVVGSDIAGYHGPEPIPPDLYIRWTQFSTFCGLFLNGGHGERRMWMRSELELEQVRKYSWLHTELIPYMYSYVYQWCEGGQPLMRPMKLGKYQYMLGDWLLVAPIYQKSNTRTVVLPPGKWRWFFDDHELIDGNKSIVKTYSLDTYPVFIKEGAIIPMEISRNYTGIGERDWEDYITLNIYPEGKSSFTLYYPENDNRLDITVVKEDTLTVELKGALKKHILRIFYTEKPSKVLKDDSPLSDGIEYNQEKNRLIIKSNDTSVKKYEIK
ncbi:MAG: glycoside hydrolase family 31 protein [Candidatus Hydrogenedentes bacterium]|nr:glycoside hydrolase family 31 protein [Candidatus Hydrogenedentota bacterium]